MFEVSQKCKKQGDAVRQARFFEIQYVEAAL